MLKLGRERKELPSCWDSWQTESGRWGYQVTLTSLVRDAWHKRILRCFPLGNSISLRPRTPMPSLLPDPPRFQGWGNWMERADIQQAKKKTSAFLPRLGGSGLFFPSLSHLFITMLFPGPAAVSILIKANRPTNRCSRSCPLDSCQGMWSLSWGDLPLPNPLLGFQPRACVLGQLMSFRVFWAWYLSWHHGLKLAGVVGMGWACAG